MKRWAKLVVLVPIVLIWDSFYWVLSKLYKWASWLDTAGGDKLDKWMEE